MSPTMLPLPADDPADATAGAAGTTGLASLERLTAALLGVTAHALAESRQAGDLTLSQWRALVVVVGGNGMRISDIAARLGVSMPSASRFIRRLDRRGLTEVARDPVDRRASVVKATEHGIAVTDDVIRRRQQLVRVALAAAPPIPVEADDVLAEVASALRLYA